MNGQLSLFGEENLNRTAFTENLQKLDLKAAITNLQKWNRTFDPPVELEQKIAALTWLNEQIQSQGKQVPIYLAWLLTAVDEIEDLQILHKEFPLLRKGIYKMLYDQLDEQSFDFISEALHPAEVFIQQNDFEAALRSLQQYFERYGEHPFLRELQAFVFWKQNKKHDAMIDYTFVVFADPFALKDKYLMSNTFGNKLKFLKHKLGNEDKARARMAFELWHDGQTYIEAARPSFEAFIKAKIDQWAKKPNDPIAQSLHFNGLLFLAETERLRAYPNAPGPNFALLQEKMRELNYEQYAIYVDTLKSFRNL